MRMSHPPRSGIRISKRILSQEQQRERPQLDAPLRRLPSGRGYAADCGLARQPFRCRFFGQHHLFPANEVATALQFPHRPEGRFYSGHTPPLRRFTVDYCYFHPADHCRAPAATPEATAVPVLALISLSLLTSLAEVTRRTLSSYVPGSRPGIVSRDHYDHAFQPAEHRSSGLPSDERRSRFGTVFNESHLQGLSPSSWLSYSSKPISRTLPNPVKGPVLLVAKSGTPHASRG